MKKRLEVGYNRRKSRLPWAVWNGGKRWCNLLRKAFQDLQSPRTFHLETAGRGTLFFFYFFFFEKRACLYVLVFVFMLFTRPLSLRRWSPHPAFKDQRVPLQEKRACRMGQRKEHNAENDLKYILHWKVSGLRHSHQIEFSEYKGHVRIIMPWPPRDFRYIWFTFGQETRMSSIKPARV